MAGPSRPSLLLHLRRLIGSAGSSSVADRELLKRFLGKRDEAAFELLVWRHGPMVLNVCSRVLDDEHEAEDVFQAAFVKLAQKAGDIDKGESVGSWLYKVAYRQALRARERAGTRMAREQPLDDTAASSLALGPDDEAALRELRPVLDAEVRRLPEKYRIVFILCCLQGMTNEQAARELGCPKGTVLSRLARARERLRRRLDRRGVIAGLLLPFLIARCGEHILSADLAATTVEKAMAAASAGTAAEAAPRWPVGRLALIVAAATAVLGVAVTSAGAFFHLTPSEPPAPASTVEKGGLTGCGCRGSSASVALPAGSGSVCEHP